MSFMRVAHTLGIQEIKVPREKNPKHQVIERDQLLEKLVTIEVKLC